MRKHGFDFDGVWLGNVRELRAQAARELFGLDAEPVLFHRKGVVMAGLLAPEQYSQVIGVVADDPRFMEQYKPMPGFPEYVLRLLDGGETIVNVTMRRPAGAENARIWSCELGLPEDVEFRATGEEGSKLGFVRDLDSFIDDRERNLEEMVGVVRHRFLMTEERTPCECARVVCSLQEHYEALRSIPEC